jgi:hypothetical protein
MFRSYTEDRTVPLMDLGERAEELAGFRPRDGQIPLAIYEISPVLGQVLDYLVEEDPGRRLLLPQSSFLRWRSSSRWRN